MKSGESSVSLKKTIENFYVGDAMRIKQKKRGRPQKRKNLISERKKRTFINEEGRRTRWTQRYVAEQLMVRFGKTVTASHIGMIERGKNNPSIEVAEMLSKLFEKPIEELLS